MIKSLFTNSGYNKKSQKFQCSPLWPSKNKTDDNKITTIMIKSLFTTNDYNKRS